MLITILLLSAAFIIPHLLLRQMQYEYQIARQQEVSWVLYREMTNSQQEIAMLRAEITGSHRIPKRIAKRIAKANV